MTHNNECAPSTSRTNDEKYFMTMIETMKNVIKEVKGEEEYISDIIRRIVKEDLQNHVKKLN